MKGGLPMPESCNGFTISLITLVYEFLDINIKKLPKITETYLSNYWVR